MSWETIEQRPWYHDKRLWIGCGVAVGLVLLALPHLQRVVREWRGRRYIGRAEAASARGDVDAAVLNARAALSLNPKDLEALRVFARSLEKVHAPAAIQVRRQIDAIAPADAENLIGLARDCLDGGDPVAAEAALSRVSAADRQNAAYHFVAASILLARGQPDGADRALTEALKLEPGVEEYQLKQAELRLRAKDPALRSGALADLERLSRTSPKKLTALRILLADATSQGDMEKAHALAAAIAADPTAKFSERLVLLSALRLRRAGAFSSFSNLEAKQQFFAKLAEMQQAAGNRPADVYELMNWMNNNDLALMVPEWEEALPLAVTGKPPVCLAVAEAYARASAWSALRQHLEKASWGEADYLRLAYLSRSLERLKDPGEEKLWTSAVTAAQAHPAKLESLAKTAIAWSWDKRAGEVLWKIAATDHPPKWVVDQLWLSAQKAEDSAQLHRAAKLVWQSDPKSVSARNAYTILSLITGRDLEASFQLAATLAQENPGNESVAATYGLALYKQGKTPEAVRVLEELTPAQLEKPAVALYYGIFLASAGQLDKAGKYLELGTQMTRIAEEKALSEHLRLAIAAHDTEARGDAKAADEAWKGALAAATNRPDALDALGRMALQWNWTPRVEDVAQRLAAVDRCPPWAREPLWSVARRTGDSAQLYKAARLIWQSDPKSVPERDRYILLSLLTRHDADAPRRLAETLRKESPDDAEIAAAYGLSLVQDGKAEEAVAQIKRLSPGQFQSPRSALYYGIFLAAAGQTDKAEQELAKGQPAAEYPEEKTLAQILSLAGRAVASRQGGAAQPAGAAWDQAVTRAQSRPDWLEMLARIAQAQGWAEKTSETLWKLAATNNCPRWGLELLWKEAGQEKNPAHLYEASKLLAAADPTNLQARNSSTYLALLAHREQDFPTRSAASLYHDHPTDPEIVTTYGLALFQQGKTKDALALMAGLKPEQLQEPRPALFYGIFLAASGQAKEAEKYLARGASAAQLPEEVALLAQARSAPAAW